MNPLDLLAAAYIAISAFLGSRIGVAQEGYRFFRLLVSVLTGCGLFALLDKALQALLGPLLSHSRGIGYVIALGLVFFAMRKLKAATLAWLQRKFAEKFNRLGGAIAGFLRAVTAVGALVAFLHLSPWLSGGNSTMAQSWIGRTVHFFDHSGTDPAAPAAPQAGNRIDLGPGVR